MEETSESFEELAQRNGFDSFDALRAASQALVNHEGVLWYIALDPKGRWFVWNDQGRILTGEGRQHP